MNNFWVKISFFVFIAHSFIVYGHFILVLYASQNFRVFSANDLRPWIPLDGTSDFFEASKHPWGYCVLPASAKQQLLRPSLQTRCVAWDSLFSLPALWHFRLYQTSWFHFQGQRRLSSLIVHLLLVLPPLELHTWLYRLSWLLVENCSLF